MSHRILRYTVDGEERFAVWSTVVEDWIWWDAPADELRRWYFGREMERAREHITERIETLREGENPYMMWDADEKRRQLLAELHDN